MNFALPYNILYIIIACLVGCSLAIRHAKFFGVFAKKGDAFFGNIIFLVLVFFISLRTKYTGVDTPYYVDFFHNSNFIYLGSKTDPLFELFARFIHFFSSDERVFIAVVGFVSLFGVYLLISRISMNKSVSWMLFTISGTTYIYMFLYLFLMRQVCAITFFLMAVLYFFQEERLTKKRIVVSSILYIGSVLIHGTSLMALPFIFLARKKLSSKKAWYLMLVISYMMAAFHISFVSNIVNFLFPIMGMAKYAGYRNVSFGFIENTGMINMYILPTTIEALMVLYIGKKEYIKKWYVQFFLYSAVMTNVFYDNLMWPRLILYISIFSIVVIPNVLSFENKKVQFACYSPIIAYFTFKFFRSVSLDPIIYENWLVKFLF